MNTSLLLLLLATAAIIACTQAKPHGKAHSATLLQATIDRKPQDTAHGTEGLSVAYGVQRIGAAGWSLTPHPITTKSFLSGEYAYGIYTESIESVGWNLLEVHTNPAYPDGDTAEAAGYFEGYVTSERMYQTAVNNGNLDPIPPKLVEFLNTNNQWMVSQIASAMTLPNGDPERVYWTQVSNILRQLQGLASGYGNSSTGVDKPMSNLQVLSLSLGGDMEDLGDATAEAKPSRETLAFRPSHCSALIKLLDNNADIYVAQDTWSTLNSMMRIYKLYDFAWKVSDQGSLVPAVRSSFSSYPGSLFSGDDFYVLSSGLIEMETTIGNSNPDLISKITPQSNLEWLRNMVANRLAVDGYSWTQIYSKYNSGTYNNMNMIVDLNKFTPGQTLKDGTVWIAEQIPGLIKANDMTKQVQAAGYFASYNVAYDPEIRQQSGADDLVKQYGNWFSFDNTARAEIFRREAPGVKDLDSMQRLMRLNDYKNDPFSTQLDTCEFRGWTNCTPAYTAENTIACRDDLNPADGVYSLPSFAQRNHVATDAKISSYSLFNAKTVPSVVISGPTYDQQPVFVFSTSPYNTTVSWLGLPDSWKFPWVNVYWN